MEESVTTFNLASPPPLVRHELGEIFSVHFCKAMKHSSVIFKKNLGLLIKSKGYLKLLVALHCVT